MRARGILVNRKSAIPLHRQLTSALRDAILSGRLTPGQRLLSSRELQTHLGLSRNTIVDALGQLHAEGHLVTLRGVGTFVAQHVYRRPEDKNESKSGVVPPPATAYLSAQSLAANLHETVPFRPGVPALNLFPSAQFKRSFNARDWTCRLLDYPDPLGYEPLRAAIARRLQQTRGIACSPDQVLVTNGAQAAFMLIVRVLLKKGDLAVVEDPGYPNVRATLMAHGARILAAPVDWAGIDVGAFARRRARVVYVTPSHQYPSGAVLSLDRRFALLAWAEKRGGWIVEDDYDSEFNYTDRAQPALHGLAEGGPVVYVGTFSKVLSPALRIAYIVVPPALRDAFTAAQQVTGGTPDAIVQSALARFMDAGHLGRHIAKMRKVYDERRKFVAAALSAVPGEVFRVRDSRAGLHFIAELADGIRDDEVSERAARAGVIVPPLSSYFHGKVSRNGLVIGYAASALPDARKAIAALTSAVSAVENRAP